VSTIFCCCSRWRHATRLLTTAITTSSSCSMLRRTLQRGLPAPRLALRLLRRGCRSWRCCLRPLRCVCQVRLGRGLVAGQHQHALTPARNLQHLLVQESLHQLACCALGGVAMPQLPRLACVRTHVV
jgi:hypothetical protein